MLSIVYFYIFYVGINCESVETIYYRVGITLRGNFEAHSSVIKTDESIVRSVLKDMGLSFIICIMYMF